MYSEGNSGGAQSVSGYGGIYRSIISDFYYVGQYQINNFLKGIVNTSEWL